MVSSHSLFKGDSSPTYLLSFLEVGVFSPNEDKCIKELTKISHVGGKTGEGTAL